MNSKPVTLQFIGVLLVSPNQVERKEAEGRIVEIARHPHRQGPTVLVDRHVAQPRELICRPQRQVGLEGVLGT